MKKYDLLKVLGISFLVIVAISWVVPAGVYSNGSFVSMDATAPIGFYDIARAPLVTVATFVQYAILFLAIGGFYGVLNKTGAYGKLVDGITDKWSKKSKKFLIITTLIFALLSSICGLNTVTFILVPFFISILLKLGFKKITAFAATVGALLVGQIGSTLGLEVWGYLKVVFSQLGHDISMTSLILVRAILLIITVTLFILLIRKNDKDDVKDKKTKKEEVEIPLYEKKETKKGIIPLLVIGLFAIILLFVGLYNWYYTFDIDFFTNLHESITEFEINGYPLFTNLLGTVSEIGNWGNYDIAVILIIASLIISWVYSIKFKDTIDGFVSGMKQMLAPAIYAMLASVIFSVFINTSANFVFTMVNQFTKAGEFSLPGTIGSALVSSFTYNDFSALASYFLPFYSTLDSNMIPVVALIFQSIFGLVMLIAPTSIFLLAGLSYLKIPYKEWAKYIWKFTLIILGVIVVISFIATALI